MSGVFTATEASVVAVLYALVVGLLVYRELSFRVPPRIFVDVGRTTGVLGFLIATACIFAHILAMNKVPDRMAAVLLGVAHNKILLLPINLFLFPIGTFLDIGPALVILVPVLKPLAMDEIHFGVMVVINVTIGLVSPPVGTTLFVACGISEATIAEVTPTLLKLLAALACVQLLTTFMPQAVLLIPSLFLGK